MENFDQIPFEQLSEEELEDLQIEELESRLEMASAGTTDTEVWIEVIIPY